MTLAVIAVGLPVAAIDDRRQGLDAARVVVAGALEHLDPIVVGQPGGAARFIGALTVAVAELRAIAPSGGVAAALRLMNRGGAAIDVVLAVDVDAAEPQVGIGVARTERGRPCELVDRALIHLLRFRRTGPRANLRRDAIEMSPGDELLRRDARVVRRELRRPVERFARSTPLPFGDARVVAAVIRK